MGKEKKKTPYITEINVGFRLNSVMENIFLKCGYILLLETMHVKSSDAYELAHGLLISLN